MIRTLKRKFVFTAMLVATALLLAVVVAINTVNFYIHIRQVDTTIDIVSRHRDTFTPPRDFSEKRPFMQNVNADAVMSRRYFTVTFEGEEIVGINTDRISTVTEEEARTLAATLVGSEKTRGFIGSYRYRISVNPENIGKIVFCDFTFEANNARNIALISLAVALVVWLVMFLAVNMLASRAISPVIENIERQKRFVTNAGHELKTPISVIRSNAEAMELYNGENKWSTNIRLQTEKLSRLTHELVALARLDEGIKVVTSDINASELLSAQVEEMRVAAEARGISILAEIPNNVTVKASETHLAQVVYSLLDNAIKYTPRDGNIRISLHKGARWTAIEIENSIDEKPCEDVEKLFERFYRSDSARDVSGFGIGLSSARQACECMGASLDAEYVSEKSILFRIKLK